MIAAAPLLLLLAAWAQAPPQQVFDEAVAALRRGDFAQARQGFERVLQTQPNHLGALGNLGVTHARLEQFDEAARVYRRALKLAPRDAGLQLNLGLALLKQERYAEALPALDAVLTVQPQNAQARELKATAQLYAGAAGAALATLTPLAPGPGVLFLRGLAHLKLKQPEESARAFAELESHLPPSQMNFLRGRAYYETGLFEEAARELAGCAEGSVDCRRELAKVQVSQRKAEEAEAGFRAVLAAKPGDREASYFLGALLIEAGRAGEGAPLLTGAGSGFWASRYYLGKAALKENRAAEAIGHFQAAAEQRPEEPNLLYQLMRAYQAAGQRAAAAQTAARLRAARSKQREGEQAALVLR